ncbi:MAG: hypothetical protein CMK59_12360 [Proteobacteria bacterium]|nr:hypothetical protein [Pseudomonadota bacterium]
MGKPRRPKQRSEHRKVHGTTGRKKKQITHQHGKARKEQVQCAVSELGVVVNSYSAEWLNKDFDWVYANEIVQVGSKVRAGTWVELLEKNGRVLGFGLYVHRTEFSGESSRQEESLSERMRVAVYRFDRKQPISDLRSLVGKRLQSALKRREQVCKETQIYRLVHAENDDLPGIRVDIWGEAATVVFADEHLLVLQESICDEIPLFLEHIEIIYGHVRAEAGQNKPLGCLWKRSEEIQEQDHYIATELDCRYRLDPKRSPDAGVFCDMRGLRKWLAPHWGDKKLLNLFCFTGAFSVHALRHGAEKVTSVDLSGVYLNWLTQNIDLNDLNQEQHEPIEGDALKVLDRLRRTGQKFDVVLADPPSFSHSETGTWSVQNDLTRLVNAMLRVLAPEGLLILASNHGKLPPKQFSKAILDASRKVSRRLRLVHVHQPGPDVPALLAFPSSRYLKCWVLQG